MTVSRRARFLSALLVPKVECTSSVWAGVHQRSNFQERHDQLTRGESVVTSWLA